MSTRIFKYAMQPGQTLHVRTGRGNKVLLVDEQFGAPTLWIETDEMPSDEMRVFEILPTGAALKGYHTHVGSVVMREHGVNGSLVWHVYEVIGVPVLERKQLPG